MREVLRVSIWGRDTRLVAFRRFVADWAKRGYGIEQGPSPRPDSVTARVPLADRRWRRDVTRAVKAGVLDDDWAADWIEQVYTGDEIAGAPLFSAIHNGRTLNFPMGRDKRASVSHIADVEDRDACKRCGIGARQVGPLRIPGAELNKAGNLASIWLASNTFWMMSDSLIKTLERACGERLAVTRVKTVGKTRTRESWWQLTPEWALPIDAVRPVRWRRKPCSECRGIRLDGSINPFGAYFTARRPRLQRLQIPPLLLCPFWDGELQHGSDGRVRQFPQRRLWLRGDVARAMAKLGNRRFYLTPIIVR